MGVGHLDLFDRGPQPCGEGGDRLRFGDHLQAPLDILSVQLSAIVEGDSFAEQKRPGHAVGRHLLLLGGAIGRGHRAISVGTDHEIVHNVKYPLLNGVSCHGIGRMTPMPAMARRSSPEGLAALVAGSEVPAAASAAPTITVAAIAKSVSNAITPEQRARCLCQSSTVARLASKLSEMSSINLSPCQSVARMHRHAWPLNRAEVYYFRYFTWATNVKPEGSIEHLKGEHRRLLVTSILRTLDSHHESSDCERN